MSCSPARKASRSDQARPARTRCSAPASMSERRPATSSRRRSRHISGRLYAWSVDHHPADVPLAEPPGWLLERLAERPNGRRRAAVPRETWERLTSRDVREYGDAAAAQVAGHLLRRWVDPYLVAGLLHAWNQTYCSPPLPDDELRRVLDRVARREDQRRDAAASSERGRRCTGMRRDFERLARKQRQTGAAARRRRQASEVRRAQMRVLPSPRAAAGGRPDIPGRGWRRRTAR